MTDAALGVNSVHNGALLTDLTGYTATSDGGPNTPTIAWLAWDDPSLPAQSPLGYGGVGKGTWTGSNNNNTPFPAGVGLTFDNLVAGATYTMSGYFYVPTGSGDVRLLMDGHTADTTLNDQWQRLTITWVASAAAPVTAIWSSNTPPSAGQVFYWTGLMIQPGSDVGNFAQGGGAAGDAATVLVDGADTAVTANGLAGYLPSPGDRLLVDRVGGVLEVVQFLSRGIVPYLTGTDYTDLSTQITNAQTTANGKNTVYYSTGTPGSTANTAGDIWFQESAGVIIAQWVGAGGTTWNSTTVGSAVIANLDAGKITVGTLSGITISGNVVETAAGAGSRMVLDNLGINGGRLAIYNGVSGEVPGLVQPWAAGEIQISSGSTPTLVSEADIFLQAGTAGNSSITIDASLVSVPGKLNIGNVGSDCAGFQYNTQSVTTDSTGAFTISHSLGVTPKATFITSQTAANLIYHITSLSSTAVTFKVVDNTGAAYASHTFSVNWLMLA